MESNSPTRFHRNANRSQKGCFRSSSQAQNCANERGSISHSQKRPNVNIGSNGNFNTSININILNAFKLKGECLFGQFSIDAVVGIIAARTRKYPNQTK